MFQSQATDSHILTMMTAGMAIWWQSSRPVSLSIPFTQINKRQLEVDLDWLMMSWPFATWSMTEFVRMSGPKFRYVVTDSRSANGSVILTVDLQRKSHEH